MKQNKNTQTRIKVSGKFKILKYIENQPITNIVNKAIEEYILKKESDIKKYEQLFKK